MSAVSRINTLLHTFDSDPSNKDGYDRLFETVDKPARQPTYVRDAFERESGVIMGRSDFHPDHGITDVSRPMAVRGATPARSVAVV